MILDLDGAIPEPSRRRHVAVLSAAATAVAIVLWMVLFAPAARMDTPSLGASAAPSPASMTVVFASDSLMWTRGGPFEASLRDAETRTECAAGIGSSPPVHLVLDSSGRPIAAYTSGVTGRFIALPQAYFRSGWLTVPCDTSDVFAPRLNRAR